MQVNFSAQLFALLFLLTPMAHADSFQRVGEKFHIKPLLLKAIARKESHFYNHAVNHTNSDRTEDVCMMGINSSHFRRLRQFNITRNRLLTEPDVCVAAGAWILNGFFERYGRSWDSVGMYNTGPALKLKQVRANYAASVRKIYRELAREAGVAPDPFG